MLVVLSVVRGSPPGAWLPFSPGEYVFGRNADSDVVLVHRSASRRHFLLHVAEDSAFVRDLFSRNRTMVNSHILTGQAGDYQLRDGDTVYVGGIDVRFRVQVFPGESGDLNSGNLRQTAICQHGTSPGEQTVALTSSETAVVRLNPID